MQRKGVCNHPQMKNAGKINRERDSMQLEELIDPKKNSQPMLRIVVYDHSNRRNPLW